MRCPSCGSDEDRVIDSRSSKDKTAIRRRRECVSCGRRFTTYEYVESVALSVVKKDGRREAFNRDKLVTGLQKACEKRPVSREDIDAVADRIHAELLRGQSSEVTTAAIGDLVMRELVALDPVAYVRFASVYRHFTDVQQFEDVIRELE
jgi:transcriptional repressor NrdR